MAGAVEAITDHEASRGQGARVCDDAVIPALDCGLQVSLQEGSHSSVFGTLAGARLLDVNAVDNGLTGTSP